MTMRNIILWAVIPSSAGTDLGGLFPSILKMLKVPNTRATLVTLVYRLFTFWLLFGVGFFSFRLLQKQTSPEENRGKMGINSDSR
jgi:uncharacterized membrane protein YbhN (UPF0104 family)